VQSEKLLEPGAQTSILTRANEIIENRHCPCGCGRYLPGSPNTPACFGCSVGKAEVTRIIDALAAGRSAADIIVELNETILVDVFADYPDVDLSDTWSTAVRIAGEFKQRRVVLRAPGETAAARRAIRLAECAREQGKFAAVQAMLIEHGGPWDVETLIEMAGEAGIEKHHAEKCLEKIDIRAQVSKDNEHARIYGVRSYPSIVVNRELVSAGDEALRKVIRGILEDESI